MLVDRSELWKGRPVKALTEGKRKQGGRNNHGPHHAALARRRPQAALPHRSISSGRSTVNRRKSCALNTIPTASAFIALIKYEDGSSAYILAPQRLKAGDKVVSGERVDVKPGNAMPMSSIPVGTIIHNVEMKPGKGGQLARAAGTFVQLVGPRRGLCAAAACLGRGAHGARRMHGHHRRGVQSRSAEHLHRQGRAQSRWLGRLGNVRGEAMNPVDHPLGGRTRGGRHPVSPWGQGAKGDKTRHNKATDRYIVRRRRQK